MSFTSLKKNDVIYSESKDSRVFKLISKKNNKWIVEDVFSKKTDTITEQDQFKIVKTETKIKPISMLRLFEDTKSNSNPTLTEKEVFLVDELIETHEEEYLHGLISEFENGDDLNVGFELLGDYLKFLNLSYFSKENKFGLIQYVYCAIENYNNEISQSTPITRFKTFYISTTEVSDERKYQELQLTFFALDKEMAIKIQEGIMSNIYQYDPDYGDSDYGDSEFIGFGEVEVREELGNPLIIN